MKNKPRHAPKMLASHARKRTTVTTLTPNNTTKVMRCCLMMIMMIVSFFFSLPPPSLLDFSVVFLFPFHFIPFSSVRQKTTIDEARRLCENKRRRSSRMKQRKEKSLSLASASINSPRISAS